MLSTIRIPLSEIVRCGPHFCSVKITEDVRQCAAKRGTDAKRSNQECRKRGKNSFSEVLAVRPALNDRVLLLSD
jgi:hypothetical protein